MWGSCFWFCIPVLLFPALLSPPSAIFHTQLCHTPSFTHNFVTHHLPHTTLSHAIFHTQLCHTPSFTHHLCQPSLSRTIFVNHLCQPPSFHVAGTWQAWHFWHWAGSGGALGPVWVAGDAAWQAWHLATSTFVLRGRRGTYSTGLALVARLARFGRRWRRGTLRGRRGTWRHVRRGTWRHLLVFCVAGVARTELGWFWWRAWARLGRRWRCVAGVALGDIHLRFAWQAWHLVIHLRFARQAWHLAQKKARNDAAFTHTHTTFTHAIFHTQLCHTHTHIIFLCHTPTFICNFFTTTSTTSFVFPSFPVPATTFGAHYWKKLTCGVIRSFNCGSLMAKRIRWWTERWLELCFSEWLQYVAMVAAFTSPTADGGSMV